jgi:hypothetical protein
MNDATKNGASATEADTQENEELDTGTKNAQDSANGAHPVQERQHPFNQREAALARFEAQRKAEQPDAAVQGDLGTAIEEVVEEESEEVPVVDKTTAPAQDADEEFIVKVEGKSFFKTKVDGEEKLVPLSRARDQLQKHEAAELRLQRASAVLRDAEQKAAAAPRSPSATDVSAEDDAALKKRAAELVTSLIDDDPETAATKLADALKSVRAPSAKPADVKEIAAEVVKLNTVEQQNAALRDGYNAYLKEFGEVITDPALVAWHSAKVDELAAANPSWTPKEAMLKAGEMACEFAKIERGSTASNAAKPGAKPAQEATPPAQTRQQRKQDLQPVPQSRSAVLAATRPEAPAQSTPQSVVDEYRKARGQPVVQSRKTG